jgi:hypothetical protein
MFCIQAISFMLFRGRRSRYTTICNLRSLTLVACFSKSVVYAATQSVLSTNCSRTAIITGGILFSVLLGGFRRQLDVEASTGRCSFDRCERAQCLRLK